MDLQPKTCKELPLDVYVTIFQELMGETPKSRLELLNFIFNNTGSPPTEYQHLYLPQDLQVICSTAGRQTVDQFFMNLQIYALINEKERRYEFRTETWQLTYILKNYISRSFMVYGITCIAVVITQK